MGFNITLANFPVCVYKAETTNITFKQGVFLFPRSFGLGYDCLIPLTNQMDLEPFFTLLERFWLVYIKKGGKTQIRIMTCPAQPR